MERKPIEDKLLSLAEEGFQHGKKLGIDALKIKGDWGEEKRLVLETDGFTLATTNEGMSLGFGVHHAQKKGSASIEQAEVEAVKRAIEQAKTLASFSIPDPNLNMPTPAMAPRAKELPFLYDPAVADVTLEMMKPIVKEGVALLTADKRLALDRVEVSSDVGFVTLGNSHGVRQQEWEASMSWSLAAMARDGDDVSGMDYDSGFSFTWKDFPERFLNDVMRFKARVLSMLETRPCPTYKGVVVLSPRAVGELLIETILYHMGGWQIMDGKSKWQDHIGKSVAKNLLTLIDRPHDPRLQGATAYDEDGLPTRDLTLVENGMLKMHLFDCYSAKKTGNKPTGASGGPFSLTIPAGTTSEKTLYGLQNKLLAVETFAGNLDALTGDFSGLVKVSHLYEKGVDVGCVNETMIAGNVFDMLKNIVAVGDQQHDVWGSYLFPAIAVDGISVSSGEG